MNMIREALFSKDHKHRFLLHRAIDYQKPSCLWIMMNPSVADEYRDDNITRYATNRTFRSGFGVYEAVNLWPVVGTDSRPIMKMSYLELFGEKGRTLADFYIRNAALKANMIVIAWGAAAGATDRAKDVASMIAKHHHKLQCLGLTKEGYPRFPRAVPHKTPLVRYLVKMKK